ncbi:MAG: DinB family protein [Flavobacteriales bacterium]
MQDKSIYTAAPAYYAYYFDLVKSNDLIQELRANVVEAEGVLSMLPEEKWHYAYADNKWTIAEVVRHVIETERIFAYRALRLSRLDDTPLAGFNENSYIANLHAVRFSKDDTMRELRAVRESTVCLFNAMNDEMLHFLGNANGLSVSAEMLGFMIVGHTCHHIGVIEERYM